YSALLPVKHTGIDQDLQMVRDRGLTQAHRIDEIADAGLIALVRCNKRDEPQPSRVGDRFEDPGEHLRTLDAQRIARQRRTARCRGWQSLFSLHSSTMPIH